MRNRIAALITAALLSAVFAGCNYSANENANANRTAAPANTATATPTPTPVANTRRAPTREEYEREKERYSREAKEAGRTIGTGLNDGWLWVKTRFDLAAADDLRDSTINVDVDKGVVTLTGTVASAAQKARAEAVVKSVEDVKSVKNMLKVAPSNANAPKANANK
jgi:hypothetical protein